jgi:hypothetical protein
MGRIGYLVIICLLLIGAQAHAATVIGQPKFTAYSTHRQAEILAIQTGKQPQINGTGFVKASGTTISYDNSTYLTTTGSAASLTGFPTLNQNTTGSAATLTTARTLAGNSFNGSANVPFPNKFIVQGTTDAGLTGAQFLGALGTGIIKNTTTTGVLSVAVAGDFPTLNQSTTGSAATLTTPRSIQGASFNGSADINPINGTGFVKATGTTLSYDNSTYLTSVSDATITTTDITTNNASTSKHGFFPKLPAATGKFLKDDLTWAAIAGGGDLLASNNLSDVASAATARNNILPSKTGNTLKVLRVNAAETDYELATVSGGGVVGTTGQISYNNAGTMAGDGRLTFDNATGQLEVGKSANGGLELYQVSAEPSPPTGALILYSKNIGGRVMPKWIGPSGIDTPIQPFLGFNKIIVASPAASGTTVTTHFAAMPPGSITNAGTASNIAMATGATVKAKMRWGGFASGTTAGNMATSITPNYEAKIAGGFFFSVRFGAGGTIVSGQRQFHGLWASTTASTNVDPTAAATAARIGIAYNLTGTAGNLLIVAGNGSAAFTPVDLGATDFAVNNSNIFEFTMFCAPGASSIGYRVTNLENGVQATGTISGNIPGSTTLLAVQNWVTNNATAAAATMLLNRYYLETDY